jgi:PleD family two-component response regulator
VSIGVASPQPGETLDAAICAADAALYRAKRAGRNRVNVAEPSLRAA